MGERGGEGKWRRKGNYKGRDGRGGQEMRDMRER